MREKAYGIDARLSEYDEELKVVEKVLRGYSHEL